MSWLQLDPASLARRAAADGGTPRVPGLGASMTRGALGFCVVSVAGFVPWAVFGRALHQWVGELGMYVVCMLVFLALSGLLLHPLILGRGNLGRFSKLFAAAFALYSAGWIAGWMLLRGHPGSLAGLLVGTGLMAWVLARAFDAQAQFLKVLAALFLLNSLGYFIGGWSEGAIAGLKQLTIGGTTLTKSGKMTVAMLSWGVFYGLGFGAGLGLAFHLVQSRARSLLAGHPDHTPTTVA